MGAARPRPSNCDTLRRSCAPDAQTRGEMRIALVLGQASAKIVRVRCAKVWTNVW